MSPSFSGNRERSAATLEIALLFLKVILPSRYLSPSSMGIVISTALPAPACSSGMWGPLCPVSWISVLGSPGTFHFEVAAILVFGPHPLGVFFQFGRVVGLGEDALQEDGMRNSDRLQVLHGRAQNARLNRLVAIEPDFADLDLRPFLDHERNSDRCRRNLPHFCADRGELPAVLGKQVLDGNFRLLDASRIILALDHEPDLILLEAVEDVAVGNGTGAQRS